MSSSFTDFLDALDGQKPMPKTKFICHKGELRAEQIDELARVVRANKTSGGFKLEGKQALPVQDRLQGLVIRC